MIAAPIVIRDLPPSEQRRIRRALNAVPEPEKPLPPKEPLSVMEQALELVAAWERGEEPLMGTPRRTA